MFVLVPGFSMIALYSALEPLRVANRFGGELFRWRFVSIDGEAVTASNGIPVSVEGRLAGAGRPNLAVVCSSYDHDKAMSPALRAALRRLDGAGVWLGGLDTGPILLAHAGLAGRLPRHLPLGNAGCHARGLSAGGRKRCALRDRRGTAHRVRRDGTAGHDDCMDRQLARASAGHPRGQIRWFMRAMAATPVARALPRAPASAPTTAMCSPPFRRWKNIWKTCCGWKMWRHSPGASPRQLERRFKAALGMGPMRFYLGLRLERAERLLTYSRLSVRDVGLAAGFSSMAQFSRAYRARFGLAAFAAQALQPCCSRHG
jgi:AraC family carnitine catabolism transcriptional activator